MAEMFLPSDEAYMNYALQLAEPAAGQTGTNPQVGCVLVKEGRIIGIGSHLRRGEAHAEIHALRMAGTESQGATAYVTLEPCSHTGKTGPCADALIAAGVRRVVIAATDPNPLVSGNGIRKLEDAGIEVVSGICMEAAVRQQEMFRYSIARRIPFVTLKAASTLDGKLASVSGDSKWITNEQSRHYVHGLRHRHQAIITGIGTVLADDPSLTTRLSVPGLDPVKIVIDSKLSISSECNLIKSSASNLIVCTTWHADPQKIRTLEAAGLKVWITGTQDAPAGHVDLQEVLQRLYQEGIGSVLLEGGSRLNGAMLDAGLVAKVILFFAPKWIGGVMAPPNADLAARHLMSDALQMEHVTVQTFGTDVCITGYPVRKGAVDQCLPD